MFLELRNQVSSKLNILPPQIRQLRPGKESDMTKINGPPSVDLAPYSEVPQFPQQGASEGKKTHLYLEIEMTQ